MLIANYFTRFGIHKTARIMKDLASQLISINILLLGVVLRRKVSRVDGETAWWWWCYPIPSEGWGHGRIPRRPDSRATPQGLDQRSKMEEVVPTMARPRGLKQLRSISLNNTIFSIQTSTSMCWCNSRFIRLAQFLILSLSPWSRTPCHLVSPSSFIITTPPNSLLSTLECRSLHFTLKLWTFAQWKKHHYRY